MWDKLRTSTCLPVMAALAQGLPIAFIPEKVLVSPVREDMVHDCGRREFPVALTFQA